MSGIVDVTVPFRNSTLTKSFCKFLRRYSQWWQSFAHPAVAEEMLNTFKIADTAKNIKKEYYDSYLARLVPRKNG